MSQPRMYADGTTGAQGGKSPQGGQQPVPQPLPQQNGGGEQAGGKGAQGGGGVPPQMAALAAQQRGGGGAFGQIAMPQAGSAGGVKPITATNYYGELTATPAASNPATTGARTDATTIVPIPKTEKKKKDTAATAATDLDLYNRIKMVQTANGTNGAPPVAPPPNPDYGKKKPLKEWTPLDDAWYKYEQDWANYNRT